MAAFTFTVNGRRHTVDVLPDTTLLWVIRDHLRFTGTKFGCGIGLCGTCTVHVDGRAARSCLLRMDSIQGRSIVTIEGLSSHRSHPLQKAWIEEQVSQCGYCQPGQLMQAADLLSKKPNPSREEIIEHMNGVLCRCGTYSRIIRAIQRAAREV